MSLKIQSGGTNSDEARVGTDGRLWTDSSAVSRCAAIGKATQRSFGVTSLDAGVVAGEYQLYIKNDDTTRDLVISSLVVGSDVTIVSKLTRVTGTGGGASAAVVRNLTVGSNVTASATILGNAAVTGLTAAGDLGILRTGAGVSGALAQPDSIRLTNGEAIAVENDVTAGGHGTIACEFYFEAPAS